MHYKNNLAFESKVLNTKNLNLQIFIFEMAFVIKTYKYNYKKHQYYQLNKTITLVHLFKVIDTYGVRLLIVKTNPLVPKFF